MSDAAKRYRELRDRLGDDHPLTQLAFGIRLNEVLDEEAAAPESGLWWLSFVDPTKSAPRDKQVPGGGGFLGVIIIRADGYMQAIMKTHELGINPGGEVAGYGPYPDGSWPDDKLNRLITKAELDTWPEEPGA